MKAVCPQCGVEIPASDVVIDKNIARCRNCGVRHQLSDIVDHMPGEDIDKPPQGAWFRVQGSEVSIGATIRGSATSRSAVLAALVFNVVLWWMAGLFIWGTPPTTGAQQRWGAEFIVGMMSVIALLVLVWVSIYAIVGRVEVRIDTDTGKASVFSGVGPVGTTQPFDSATITRVVIDAASEEHTEGGIGSPSEWTIRLEGSRRVDFARMLTKAQRRYLAAALRKTLGAGR